MAVVRRRGVHLSKTFTTKGMAEAWAADKERKILLGAEKVDIKGYTVEDMLKEYLVKKTAAKRGKRSEELRINRFLRDPIAKVKLALISKNDIASWRDRRMAKVSSLSVLREWTTLSHAFKVAIHEWEWMAKHPMTGVEKPTKPPARDRRAESDELERVIHCSGWDRASVPQTTTARVGAAVEFAVETAMRAKEICELDRKRDIQGRVAKIRDAKTPSGIREVPLSTRAREIVDLLLKADLPGTTLFGLQPSQVDALYRKIRKRAMVDGLRFHDLRAEACTRLAKRLTPLQLAKMLGHSDLSKLMIYYREKAEDIADLLG